MRATQLDEDVREHMLDRVAEMVLDSMSANGLEVDDFISVIFTATSDLVSEFPAYAARQLGFGEVPLLCARELEIAGSMPRVVRMLAHVDTDLPRADITHVYLHGAAALRTDLTRTRSVLMTDLDRTRRDRRRRARRHVHRAGAAPSRGRRAAGRRQRRPPANGLGLGAGRPATDEDRPQLVVVAVPPDHLGAVIRDALERTNAVVTDVRERQVGPVGSRLGDARSRALRRWPSHGGQ